MYKALHAQSFDPLDRPLRPRPQNDDDAPEERCLSSAVCVSSAVCLRTADWCDSSAKRSL